MGGFSKGMQQRLGLAVALVGRPELVVLDEPTSALDPIGRVDVRDLVLSLKAQGVAVLLNSHLIGEVERVCDRVVILDSGRVAAAGTLAELLGRREVRLHLTGVDGRAEARLRAAGEADRRPGPVHRRVPGRRRRGRRPRRSSPTSSRSGVAVHAVEPARISLEERLLGILRAGSAEHARVNELRNVVTIARLTVRESARRRVLWALAVLTLALLTLSGWGFSKLTGLGTEFGDLTSGQARLVASQLLNLVMFGLSLIAALGTAFLAGPTVAGEIESGMALSVMARPIRRSALLLGKWLGLVTVGCGYVVVAGLAQFLVVRWAVGYWPPEPAEGLALLAGQTIVLLTLGLLLSSVVSPMASGVVAVGLFGATWVAGVVGGVGEVLGNEGVERVGTVSRVLLPTDGLWRGAMHAFQDPSALATMGAEGAGFPFLSEAPLAAGYLLWAVFWIAMVWGLTALALARRDV